MCATLPRVLISLGGLLAAVTVDLVSATVTPPAPSPTSSSTEAPPTSTTEDPVQKHLSIIIGVPTGIGLSVLLIGSFLAWMLISSYIKYRKSEREMNTNSTNLRSSSKGGAKRGQNAEHSSEPSNSLPGSPPPLSPTSPSSP